MSKKLSNLWVILGILSLATSLAVITFVWIIWSDASWSSRHADAPGSAMTVIPGPTSTATIPTPTAVLDTATPAPTDTPLPGTITLNAYVQISGTGGEGLRLRASPSLNSDPLFLGYDSEVYKVTDGPTQADGYTWWLLTAPYDPNRTGWAASNYLEYVPSP